MKRAKNDRLETKRLKRQKGATDVADAPRRCDTSKTTSCYDVSTS